MPNVSTSTNSGASSGSRSTKGRRARRNTRARPTMPRNPRTRPGPPPGGRNDSFLALTRDQFTATSPLNLFTVRAGTTPGGTRLRGRELVGAVSAVAAVTGTFALANIGGKTPFRFSPVDFPRLNAYTTLYDHFIFHRAAVLFQSNQPTTATGEVMVSVDYDAKDASPATTVEMMRNVSSTMANVYSDCSLEVLGSLARLPRFATAQTLGVDVDQLYQAYCYVATEGMTLTAGQVIGYLVVDYDVEFFAPQ